MNRSSIANIWWHSLRPKTLSISVTPVITGNALAWHEQAHISWPILLITLLAALCIQIGTNLYNDAADYERGADNEHRLGPERATQHGLLSPHKIKQAALLSFSSAFILGIYLAWIGGWPIIILGLSSIVCGYGYTAGPKPIAYSATGELFVLLYFGVFAVAGSYYLQTGSISTLSILSGTAIGSMASAILLINNYRDLDSDRLAKKLTLVHYIGRNSARYLYAALMIYPYAIIILMAVTLSTDAPAILLSLLSVPLAFGLIKRLFILPISEQLNQLLARTAQLQLLFSVLLSTGLYL